MRYYYTDPLAAAWMAKHFGMRFQTREGVHLSGSDFGWLWEEDTGNPHCYTKNIFYIHPDSLHLLEPQEGDIGWDALNDLCEMWESGWKMVCGIRDERGYKPIMPVEIIQRNGKAFMFPEVEA